MAVIFGFLGLLLAVPILAVTMVMVKTLYVEPMEAAARAGG
jgi:predicted PurR-regulated permease PerM